MLNEKIQDALNQQLNAEFVAFYLYLSMAAYFETENLPGFAKWMYDHALEEQTHAMKFYHFINERGGRVELRALAAPAKHWKSPLAAFENAFAHEQGVTRSINELVDLAISTSDHATNSFLQWFVDEQVEEEDLIDTVVQDLRRVGDSSLAIFMLDRELGVVEQGAAESDQA